MLYFSYSVLINTYLFNICTYRMFKTTHLYISELYNLLGLMEEEHWLQKAFLVSLSGDNLEALCSGNLSAKSVPETQHYE